jgi:hypothetical protein
MSSEVRVYETSAIHPVLVANSPFEKKFSTEINLLTEDGQEEQGREGVGATQGPDTLVAFNCPENSTNLKRSKQRQES